MDLSEFNANRSKVRSPVGELAYVDVGSGPAALFVHGVFFSSYMWRDAIAGLAGAERRCVAVDLPGHGRTPAPHGATFDLAGLADLLDEFCGTLGLDTVDVIASDTGGAVAQAFATRHCERLRTLTLTNCDNHDQFPPDAARENLHPAAEAGLLAPVLAELYANPERARELFAPAFQYPDRLSAETIREYLAPFKDVALGRALEKQMLALHAADLMAIEPQLRALEVPTVIAWGTDDSFFPIERAHWLADTIKGAERVVEIPNGKLMWPAERGAELVAVLREHWAAHATATSGV